MQTDRQRQKRDFKELAFIIVGLASLKSVLLANRQELILQS
jgi:hypothetical protein